MFFGKEVRGYMKSKKVVLAYSGGLDTSVIVHWFAQEGYEVICVAVDLGQKEDFKKMRKRALGSGAAKFVKRDAKRRFVRDGAFQCLKADAKYEGRYLMGTAIARPFIMQEVVAVAKKEDATRIAHGATGKGNDQCRFEFSCYALMPEAKIIAPWRMSKFWRAMHGKPSLPGRKELMAYAARHGIEVEVTQEKPFSTDENIAHMSHEAGVLENPAVRFPSEVYQMTRDLKDALKTPEEFVVGFVDGMPSYIREDFSERDSLNVKWNPAKLLDCLNEIGKIHAITPLDMVENRFVGMKSRGVYEAPGMTILYEAHRDLEGLCMDRDLMHLRDMLSSKYAELVYNGFWFSPTLEALNAFVDVSQKGVTGEVMVCLETGTVQILGRRSPFSLYDSSLASMEKGGTFDPRDAAGFLKIVGLPTKIQALRDQKLKKRGK